MDEEYGDDESYEQDDSDDGDSGSDGGEVHFAHGVYWEDSREYAEFLADYLGYDHDQIDYALGYDET